MRLTFKKDKPLTGLMVVGNSYQGSDIKIDGRVCGYISAPNWQTEDNKFGIRFAIKEKQENCDWKLITLKGRFDSDADARLFVKENIEKIMEKYTLHYFEKE